MVNVPEMCWRDMERRLIRRERNRLIDNGTIIPAYRMPPQLMVKDATGRWCPEIRVA